VCVPTSSFFFPLRRRNGFSSALLSQRRWNSSGGGTRGGEEVASRGVGRGEEETSEEGRDQDAGRREKIKIQDGERR